MKRIAFLTLFIALFTTFNVLSQGVRSGSINGIITDASTAEPLIGAAIVLEGTSFGATTNLEGEYNIHNIKPGTYNIIIRYLGYEPVNFENVTINPGETTVRNVDMKPALEALEEVVITVQAKGQMGAINQERASLGIKNIVSSDKINEVPDVTAAESIGRLPGVALNRSGGEGNTVVIRGLSPAFSIIEIDGVRMTGSGGDRSVGLSTISPEMLDGIELSKSLTADKDADAIGGIVNLRTAVASEGFNFSVAGRGGYNGLNNDYGDYKFSGSVSNRFLDNKVGALLNVSRERVNRSSQRLNANYGQSNSRVDDPATQDILDTIYLMWPVNMNVELQKSIRYRSNGNLVFDFKNDFMDIRFNNIISQMTMDNENRNNAFLINQSWFRSEANRTSPKDFMRTHTLSGVFNFLNTKLDVMYSYSKTTYENYIDVYEIEDRDPLKDGYGTVPIFDTYFEEAGDVVRKYYDIGGTPGNLTAYRNNRRDTVDRSDITQVISANWTIPFAIGNNFSGKITTGFKYSDKSRRSDEERIRSGFEAGGIGEDRKQFFQSLYPELITWTDLGQAEIVGIPGTNFIIQDYEWGDVLKNEYQLGWGPNLPYLIKTHDNYYMADASIRLYDRDAIASSENDYTVTEKLTAGYLMAELNIGKRIMLLPGLRYELMRTTYTSSYSIEDPFAQDGIQIGYPIPISVDDRENANFFPSLNVKIEATNWMDIRGAYYKSTSRPNFSLLSPGITTNQNFTDMRAYNPYLEPSTAHNYDLGVSFFSPKFGLFTANLFYKEMTGLLYRIQAYQPKWFDQLIPGNDEIAGEIPIELYESLQKPRQLFPEEFFTDPSKSPRMNNYPVNNPNTGEIRGIELSWQTSFWYLPGVLRGLVLDFNYTHIISDYKVPYIDFIQVRDTTVPFPRFIDVPIYATEDTEMPNQPSDIYNLRIGYDYKKFSTRLSFRYETKKRTAYDRIPERNIANRYDAPLLRMDLNMVQRFNKGFSVSLDVMNLTSAWDENYQHSFNARINDYNDYRKTIQYYGFNIQLGVRYTFNNR